MSKLENKREYEMSYFLSGDIPEDKLDNAVKEIENLISENGGENINAETPKKRRTAYPLKKQSESYFGLINFTIAPEELEKIGKSLALNKKVLRYMISIHSADTGIKQKIESAPVKPNNESGESAPAQSFDQKLDNILNR